MSADNWTKCPKCTLLALKKKQEEIAAVAESYGKVPLAEYEAALIKSREPTERTATLMECFEFVMDVGGGFSATYSARCDKCGFSHNFEHIEQIEI